MEFETSITLLAIILDDVVTIDEDSNVDGRLAAKLSPNESVLVDVAVPSILGGAGDTEEEDNDDDDVPVVAETSENAEFLTLTFPPRRIKYGGFRVRVRVIVEFELSLLLLFNNRALLLNVDLMLLLAAAVLLKTAKFNSAKLSAEDRSVFDESWLGNKLLFGLLMLAAAANMFLDKLLTLGLMSQKFF